MDEKRNLLITGCGGFVGKHLLQALNAYRGVRIYGGVMDTAEGARLTAFAAQKLQNSGEAVTPVIADITDEEAVFGMVEAARPDAVIHLAAQASVARSFREPELTQLVNVEGTRYLLKALRKYSPHARVLIVGSIDQYGNVPKQRQPIREMQPLTGKSPYGDSKRRQELLALDCARLYGQHIVLARSAPHIGTGQSRQFAVADWAAQIREMQEGTRPHVLHVGNLQIIRDIADVRDVVQAYLLLLRFGKSGEIYNVGTGRGVCMADIPPMLAMIAGIPDLKLQTDPDRLRPADILMLVADNRKLIACTGWQPQYTLEETLTDMLT